MLWLQRTYAVDFRAAVIRGAKSVDVYKTRAKLIMFANVESKRCQRRGTTSLMYAPGPRRASSDWGVIDVKNYLHVAEVFLFWIWPMFCMSYQKYISNDSRVAAGCLGP